MNLFALLAHTGIFAQIILIILFFFSVVSWAIVIRKLLTYRKVFFETRQFLSAFLHRKSLEDFKKATRNYRRTPFARIFSEGLLEWEIVKKRYSDKNPNLLQLLPSITEVMNRTASQELEELERFLPFLATTGSVSPFLGLLGTVWGILKALLEVRDAPIINLQLIAPGMSDALITTVAGLLVAIPAILAYNYFVGKIRSLTAEFDRFSSEIISDIRKELFLTAG